MEMQHRSDCGLDTCNATKHRVASSHPPEQYYEMNNGERQFPSAIGPQKHTQSSRRTLKDCKLKMPPTPPAVQSLNALKSVNCVANWTSHVCFKEKRPLHSTTTLAPNFFTLNYEPAEVSYFYWFHLFIVPQPSTPSFFDGICCLRTTKCDMNDSSHLLLIY